MSRRIASARRERGSATVEFALCGLFMVPLLLGVTGVGLALIREIQVQQVARDAGHMFAMGIDFSPAQTGNRSLLKRISHSLGITETSPSKAIILTTVKFVTLIDCQAGGYSNGCANQGSYAISKRVVLGDSINVRSAFGQPPQMDNAGNVQQSVLLNNSGDRVDPFSPAIASLWQTQWSRDKQNGQLAYISEVIVTSGDLTWTGFAGPFTSAAAIF